VLCPQSSATVREGVDGRIAERRAGSEAEGWEAVEGHQRRNPGWSRRRRGNGTVGGGFEVRDATDDERRIGDRIRHCGERLVFRAPNCECDPHARPTLVGANLCTHRMCHHCSRLRSRKLARRVRERVDELCGQGIRRYALLTLTYRDGAALDGCVDRCWRDLQKLRRRALWASVLGSVASIEIKRGERSGLWHPHIHLLLARPSCRCLKGRRPEDYGQFCVHGRISCPHALNQCCLVEAWREITGDSYVVDIRAVQADVDGDIGAAIREVVKYCTKLTEVDAEERDGGSSDVLEMHRAIRGRRLLGTTGVFRGLREPEGQEDLVEDPESRPCGICGTPWETVTAVWVEALDRYVVRWLPPRDGGKGPPSRDGPMTARPRTTPGTTTGVGKGGGDG